MAELQASVGSRWARLFAPPLNPDHLQAALSWAASSRDVGPDLTAFAPTAVVEAHAEAFSELSPQWATRAASSVRRHSCAPPLTFANWQRSVSVAVPKAICALERT